MKFLFVIPSFKTGGGNRVFIELANELADTNEVYIIFPNNSNEKNTFNLSSNVNIKPIGSLATTIAGKIWNLISCIRFINTNSQDSYLIISDPIMVLFISFIKLKNKIRFIQADDFKIFDDKMIIKSRVGLYFYKQICKLVYRLQGKYIFNSSYTYTRYVEVSKRKDVPLHIVHPAVDHHFFFPNSCLYDENEKVNIAIVGRKHPWKGLSTFIESWNILPLELKFKVGKVQIISHDDLSNFKMDGFEIIQPSSDSDIANILRNSNIFISTSWWEGFGLPPLEAMACGCSIIVSDSGGVSEYAVPDLNCLMFKPKDQIGLQEAIANLVVDKNLRRKLSLNGLETAKNFKWGKSAQQLLDIIDEIEKTSKITPFY